VRLRRKFLEMSQKGLGAEVGVSFQQIQKYESGADRISADRLFQIATALRSPIGFFFEGLGEADPALDPEHSIQLELHAALRTEPNAISILQAFLGIRSRPKRQIVVDLLQSIIDEGSNGP
jgi:transcriptional regulator with XRE-family HTH domain